MNKKISFYKLLGTGKNGTFDKVPDLQQWAVLTVRSREPGDRRWEVSQDDGKLIAREFLGNFISKWLSFFNCETYTLLLEPLESHGSWDGKKVFGELQVKNNYDEVIAVLTRATIRLNKLKYFWQNVAPVAEKMSTAKGFLFSAGIGEIPWKKQATFSIWQSKEDMKNFAYGMKEHSDVIKKTRKQDWYSEEMFTRFRIVHTSGILSGVPKFNNDRLPE
jgi:heme-degrading monooxygenase HmoA